MQLKPITSAPYGNDSGSGCWGLIHDLQENFFGSGTASAFDSGAISSDTPKEDSHSEVEAIILSRVNTPLEKHQLMLDYRTWLRSPQFGKSNVQRLENPNQAADIIFERSKRFSSISERILRSYPYEFPIFCFAILSDNFARLEEGLAIAYNTRSIEELMAALRF